MRFSVNPNLPAPFCCSWSQALSQYVMGGFGTAPLAVSSDGLNWTSMTVASLRAVYDLVYGNGVWVAVGNANSRNPRLFTSVDGQVWRNMLLPSTGDLYGVAASSSLFIAVGGASVKLVNSSDNGATWTAYRAFGASYSAWGLNIAFNAAQNWWSSVGYGGALLFSTNNGINWTAANVYPVTQYAPFVGAIATNGLLGTASTGSPTGTGTLSSHSSIGLLVAVLFLALSL